ncbi:MAG TPA: lysylphosphatidylglycerol synthase transmembrane domain-containing protein [Chloroflexota bacterium]|jgi:uncharacterized protein (TIRG00374 family)
MAEPGTQEGPATVRISEPDGSVSAPAANEPRAEVPVQDGADRLDLKRRFFNLRTLISFLIAALTLFTLVKAWGVDFNKTLEQMSRVNVPLYVCAILVYALTFPVRGKRWQRLLNNVGLDAPVPILAQTILLSWFVNCVAPLKLGDAYRGYLMRKNEQMPLTSTFGTIFSERIIDSGALFVILMVGLAFSASSMAPGHAAGIIFAAGVFMAALLVVLALMRWQGTLLVRLFPRRFQALYHRFVDGAFASFQHLPFVGLLTFLAWGCEIGRLLLVTHAVGVVLPFPGVLVVLSGASLLLTVPTPGGIGAVEVGLAALLTLFGISPSTALAVALLDRVISYWGLIAAGLPTYLFSKRAR